MEDLVDKVWDETLKEGIIDLCDIDEDLLYEVLDKFDDKLEKELKNDIKVMRE